MKVKKSILIGCILVCLSFLLISCKQVPKDETTKEPAKEEEETPENKNPYAVAQNLVEDGCFYLGDFESFEQLMELSIPGGIRISQNTDKQFVKHGEQSLKVELEGKCPGWGVPEGEPSIDIKSGKYFQKTDFSDCSKLIFEVYSAQEEDVIVWVNIRAKWACGYAFTIHHGWNTIEIEKWKLNYTYTGGAKENVADPEQTFANEINGIALTFPKYSTFKGESQLYYVDAIRAELE